MNRLKYYAIFNFLKFTLAGVLLLGIAMRSQEAIKHFYAVDGNCEVCLQAAQANPGTLYEFSQCAFMSDYDYPDNIMTSVGFSGFFLLSSMVPMYTICAAFACAAVACLSFLCLSMVYHYNLDMSDRRFLGVLMYLCFLLVIVLLTVANPVFMFFQANDETSCYIAATSPGLILASQITFAAMILLSICMYFFDNVLKNALFWLRSLSLSGYAVLSLIMAIEVTLESHNLVPAIAIGAGIATLLEIPFLLFGKLIIQDTFEPMYLPVPVTEEDEENDQEEQPPVEGVDEVYEYKAAVSSNHSSAIRL